MSDLLNVTVKSREIEPRLPKQQPNRADLDTVHQKQSKLQLGMSENSTIPLQSGHGSGKANNLKEPDSYGGSGALGNTGTLGKAMAVLDIVAASSSPSRFTDILKQSDQPRGTLHRQLSNLVEEGLLSLRQDKSYELGFKLLKFASMAWAGNEFRMIAEPHLRELHDITGETVHLGVLRGSQVIYLDKVEGKQAIRMYSQIGNASPIYCTGVGKAALAALDDQAVNDCISQIKFQKFTAHTLLNAQQLLEAIQIIRETGNAYDLEEHENGIRCVAAPIYSRDRSLVAGISVTGPAYRVTTEKLMEWAPVVRMAAGRIMENMGAKLGPRS